MSNYQMNDNSGTLFKNAKKTQENHPDFNGTVKINGVEMWISGWTKVNQDGSKRISLSFKPKDGAPQPPREKSILDDDDFM